jgi:5-methylcytosine-specific restriction endonuclease McrA
MQFINRPPDNGKALFNAIVAAKRPPTNSLLASASKKVFNSYDAYLAHCLDLSNLHGVSFSISQKNALIHAFEKPTQPLSKLRSDFITRCVVCPYCRLSESATLDHYLPKDMYPEFSVFPQNLVPSCAYCNSTKNDLILNDEKNCLLFLHPYFDKVSASTFLTLTFKIIPNAILLSYKVSKTSDMTEKEFTQISKHFQILKLGERYRKMAIDTLRERRFGLENLFNSVGKEKAVSQYLQEEAKSIAAYLGGNNWRAVLFKTLSSDEQFCNRGFEVIPR